MGLLFQWHWILLNIFTEYLSEYTSHARSFGFLLTYRMLNFKNSFCIVSILGVYSRANKGNNLSGCWLPPDWKDKGFESMRFKMLALTASLCCCLNLTFYQPALTFKWHNLGNDSSTEASPFRRRSHPRKKCRKKSAESTTTGNALFTLLHDMLSLPSLFNLKWGKRHGL